jgi:hypothetical protein
LPSGKGNRAGRWIGGLDPGFKVFHGGAEGDLSWKAVTLGDGSREE